MNKPNNKLENYSDEQLVIQLCADNPDALTEIFHRYWRKLIAIAYSHLGDQDEAEEAVQIVFIKLWDRRIDVDIKVLPNYLATAVKYAVYSMIQRENRKKEIGQLYLSHTSQLDDGEEKIYSLFLDQYVNGIVEQLPERCKLVFKFSRKEGKSIPEIAKAMNIAEKTVEAHLTKALNKIRHSLKAIGIIIFLLIVFIFAQ
ncbi:sigma-70 family RNA polymerase sigma factor [Sphingobacterium detergens]|uniref:sigma-70 family RNA polymerase sigma factor n=1 Tax=Sphingobacterium detergens TaxID=1145106 RepID=UPI003AABC63A